MFVTLLSSLGGERRASCHWTVLSYPMFPLSGVNLGGCGEITGCGVSDTCVCYITEFIR